MVRHVFLSFVVEDKSLVELFRGQAKRENSALEFADYSVREAFDSTSADYIRGQIRELINRCSVTVCLIGKTTYQSKWVDWEIRASLEMKKGLVGVRLHGSYDDLAPEALKRSNAEVVDWVNLDISMAIERAAKQAGY